MQWGLQHYKGYDRCLEYWERFRYSVQMLAQFHGFLGDSFKYQDSVPVSVDMQGHISRRQRSNKRHKPDTVNQEAKAFDKKVITEFHRHLSMMPASSDAVCLLMYNGLAFQSSSRPGQLLSVTRNYILICMPWPGMALHRCLYFLLYYILCQAMHWNKLLNSQQIVCLLASNLSRIHFTSSL